MLPTTAPDAERLQEMTRALFDGEIDRDTARGQVAEIDRGVFVTDDAMVEPALQPMRESHLVANNVLSMLDAAFMLNGRAYGMICCEETAAPGHWKPHEVQALRAIVTRIAALLASHDDPVLWQTPSLPLRSLPEC